MRTSMRRHSLTEPCASYVCPCCFSSPIFLHSFCWMSRNSVCIQPRSQYSQICCHLPPSARRSSWPHNRLRLSTSSHLKTCGPLTARTAKVFSDN